jgi:hypothetical protein
MAMVLWFLFDPACILRLVYLDLHLKGPIVVHANDNAVAEAMSKAAKLFYPQLF